MSDKYVYEGQDFSNMKVLYNVLIRVVEHNEG